MGSAKNFFKSSKTLFRFPQNLIGSSSPVNGDNGSLHRLQFRRDASLLRFQKQAGIARSSDRVESPDGLQHFQGVGARID